MAKLVRNSQRCHKNVRLIVGVAALVAVCLSVAACKSVGRYAAWEYDQQNIISDVETLSQNPVDYVKRDANTPVMTPEEQAVQFAALKVYHFSPWRQSKATLSKENAFWGVTAYPHTIGYAENLLPWSKTAMSKLVARQSMRTYPSMAKHAISVRSTSLRVMPTVKPYFFNPTLPGEGFPFDYFQNSSIHAGTPLFISHASTSGKWLFAETAFASGWVLASDVAYVTPEQEREFMAGTLYAIMRDDVPLKTVDGQYISTAYVGGIFPQVAKEDIPQTPPVRSASFAIANAKQAKARKSLFEAITGVKLDSARFRKIAAKKLHVMPRSYVYVMVPARNVRGQAEFVTVPVWSKRVAQIPAEMTPKAMAELARHIIGQRYGWGGLYLDRDCSSAVRDLFMAFGVWLPRNSSRQVDTGKKVIDLKGLTAEEKQDAILKNGIPFFSLIGMRGHIGLYLGYEPVTNMPLMLHDFWGVRTFNADRESRAIIGRIAITTLRPGEERRDVKKDYFYSRILKLQTKPGTWNTK